MLSCTMLGLSLAWHSVDNGKRSSEEGRLKLQEDDRFWQVRRFHYIQDFNHFQDIYPKCFIRMVEKAIKIMEDGSGYILAVSAYGSNCT